MNKTSGAFEMECLNMIASDLIALGFSTSTKGFTYICHTILFAIKDNRALSSVNSKIFPKIAALYGTKTANVERVCRHALDGVYFSGGLKNINSLLGFEYLRAYEKPGLANFISTLAEHNIIKSSQLKRSSLQPKKKSAILKIDRLFKPTTNKKFFVKRNKAACRDFSI